MVVRRAQVEEEMGDTTMVKTRVLRGGTMKKMEEKLRE